MRGDAGPAATCCCCLILVAGPAACSPAFGCERRGSLRPTADTIVLTHTPAIHTTVVDAAIALWEGCPNYGLDFPRFLRASEGKRHGGSRVVEIRFGGATAAREIMGTVPKLGKSARWVLDRECAAAGGPLLKPQVSPARPGRPTGMGSSIASAMPDTAGAVTELLIAHREGDGGAIDRLISLLHVELRRLAHAQLRQRRPGDTLDTISLLHESYLRLVDSRRASYQDRGHFFAVAALSMRHIVIDHARSRSRKKRGGLQPDLPLREDLVALATSEEADRFLDLDEALTRLERVDARLVKVVECRFFAGLGEKETAAALAVTERTVQRDWRRAKAWLQGTLLEQAAATGDEMSHRAEP